MSKTAGTMAVIGVVVFGVASAAYGTSSLVEWKQVSMTFQAVGALTFLCSIAVAFLTYREPNKKNSGP